MIISATHKGIRTAVHPINRQCRVDCLELHTARLIGKWYVEWILVDTKLLAQNAEAFVFSDRTFAEVYLSDSKQQMSANMSLNDLCNNVRIPVNIKSDRAPEFCGRNYEFLKSAKLKGIYLTYSEPERKNQIAPIDVEIIELGRLTHNKMESMNTPRRFWDYCLVHQTNIRQLFPRDKLQGRTVVEHVTGKTPDISKYCDFDFYDLVWYHPGLHPNYNDENRNLGRWIGVSHRILSDMCYCILTKSCTVIVETTVQDVTIDEMLDDENAA